MHSIAEQIGTNQTDAGHPFHRIRATDRKSAAGQRAPGAANLGRAKATLEFGGQVRVGGLVFLLAYRLLHGDLAS